VDMLEDICYLVYTSKLSPAHLRDYLQDNHVYAFSYMLNHTVLLEEEIYYFRVKTLVCLYNLLVCHGQKSTRLWLQKERRKNLRLSGKLSKNARAQICSKVHCVRKYFYIKTVN
jgi:hypothetical protein